MPRCSPSWTPLLDRSLIGFCSQLEPPDPETSRPRCSQSTIFEKSPFQVNLQRGKAAFPPPCFLENRGLEGVWAPPWGVLEGSGRLLGGSWLQEASWVFCRLLSGGSWAAQEPSWGPRWTQVEGQDGSKILPRRPKMSLRCLQDCPRSDFQSKSKEK